MFSHQFEVFKTFNTTSCGTEQNNGINGELKTLIREVLMDVGFFVTTVARLVSVK